VEAHGAFSSDARLAIHLSKGDFVLDCLIIGGGPAGLTAATYLARYRRSVAVYDAGHSRAALIPQSHNYPGFPSGVSGKELLQRLTRQAEFYNVPLKHAIISTLERMEDGYRASYEGGEVIARRFCSIPTELHRLRGVLRTTR
jgi:thioredoxin reductase (NADPH)